MVGGQADPMIPVIPVNNDDRLFGLLNQRGDRRLVYDLTETWPKNGSKISIEFVFHLTAGSASICRYLT